MPYGVVELGGHARLAAGGVALCGEPLLGGVGGELGVAVLEGLSAGPGDRCRSDGGGEEEDIGGNHLDQGRGTGQNGGEDPAGGDDEQADHALKGPGDDEQGVEGHQRRQGQDRPRSPQVGDR